MDSKGEGAAHSPDLSAQGRRSPFGRAVGWAAWSVLLAAAIGVPIVTFGEPRFRAIMLGVCAGGAAVALVLQRLGWIKTAALFVVVGVAPMTKLWGGTSVVILLASWHGLAMAAGVVDLALVAAFLVKAKREGWGWLFALPLVGLAWHSVLALIIVAHLFRPVDDQVCHDLESQPGVTWVSHQHRGAGQDIWVDDAGVFATFKSPSNLLMPWADAPRTSAIAFFPFDDDSGRGVDVGPAMESWEMPEFMWRTKDGALWATVLREAQGHAALVVPDPLAAFEGREPSKPARALAVEGEPNGLFEHDGDMVVWRDRVEVVRWDLERLKTDGAKPWMRPARNESPLHNLLDLDYDREGRAYFITFTGDVWEWSAATGASRYVTATFSGGGIDVAPESDHIAVGDMVAQTVTLLDRDALQVRHQRYVGHTARPVRAVPELGVVFSGDYMLGGVHAWSLDGLEAVGPVVQAGRTLRRFKWDAKRGHLYAASSCGLVRIDPRKAFAGAQFRAWQRDGVTP